MQEAPRRSLVAILSFLWSANGPTWLYAIKCGIVWFILFSDNLEATAYATLCILVGVRIIQWVANKFWGTPIGIFFIDLKWTIIWVLPCSLVGAVVIGLIKGFFGLEYGQASADALTWIVGTVIAFVVAFRLRRVTEPEEGDEMPSPIDRML